MPVSPLLAILSGVASGFGQAQKQASEDEYRKALTDHIKTQAKLDEQKLSLMAMQGNLEQQKFGMFQNLLSSGGINAGDLPPKKPFISPGGQPLPGQPGGIREVPPPQQGLIPRIVGMLEGKTQNQQMSIPGMPQEFAPIISRVSQSEGVPPQLIHSVIQAESKYNPQAVSPRGAQGLMQLMPETAQGLGIENPMDPVQNVQGGTRFLKAMLQKYNNNLPMALAAYNWGPGNLDKYGLQNAPEETKNYIASVMGGMKQEQQPGIIAPVSGKITSGMNATREGGARIHNAYDFSAPAGTPVVSPVSMTVTQARPQMSNSPGGMVWGTDQSGTEHRLLHINPNNFKVGDTVQQGQPIGTVYNMNGPHVHYQQVDSTGKPIDYSSQPQQPQPQQGPATGPRGRPILSQRDVLNLGLQYLGGVKLGDQKSPLHVDTGENHVFIDPESLQTVLTIPKTPETIQIPIKNKDGSTTMQFYTKPSPNRPGQQLGGVQTEPNAYQQGAITGTTDLVKGAVAGESPDVAGKVNLVRNALGRVEEAKNLLFVDGKPDREMLAKGFLTGPGGAGIGKSREFFSKMYQTIDAALRLETGAQATPGEITVKMNEFYPNPLDDDKTIKGKMTDLENYINGLPGIMKGKQAFINSNKPKQEQQDQPLIKYQRNPKTGQYERVQ